MIAYNHPREFSAEILRMALASMSRQPAPLDPVSYAVWYEYFAGGNPPLNQDLDRTLQAHEALDAEQIRALFRRHVSDCDVDGMRVIRNRLNELVSEVQGSAQEAESRVNGFGASLRYHAQSLEQDQHLDAVQRTVHAMLADTRDVHAVIAALEHQLQTSAARVEQLQDELRRVREEAVTDPLTGLLNRRGLADVLAREIEEGGAVTLVMLDVDHFKQLNDTYGHLLGDRVLKVLGDVLRKSVQTSHAVARYGGEEFAVILPDADLDMGVELAERIRVSVAHASIRRLDSGESIGRITISGGVACHRPGESAEALLERADAALYRAKQDERNRVHSVD